ncbi:glutathione-regulated potassium-efflux system protein KefC [Paucibacter sp. APW11]|uniref:Glutathione-regulated potassium-efflux system protein KefC n=1 Tax=Roseateles aquae TaxID=3077235 RepID=A0ABU3PAQ2_9BURK|nr:glutathione-regulated potassium-efflux system protein KefC [Paucibacter sp. APW11]MDT8999300.1 glutathione-regulated potassium-efflux system protein KefC [Paucibacter sp. APW11]
MSEHGHLLTLPLVFLAAAVLAVPLARWLRLGAILGYLVAGVLIGPSVLGLVSAPQTILELAEFGVVLMMFLVGMELEPRRLWAMRRPIFVGGSLQLLGCAAALLGLALWLLPMGWRPALLASLGLAMSSTAVAMAVLAERHIGNTSAGQGVLSVALFQDIAAIPVLALVPLLAAEGAAPGSGGWQALKAVAAIATIVLGGRLLLRPALRWIANSDTPEIFTAAALLLVLATAALMQAVGLSMALGAFLAGVLLAESEFRHELETDLAPFKGLLLGLFFIAVGMGLDLNVLREQPLLVLGLLAALLLAKTAVLLPLARGMRIAPVERPVFVILLAQGGEFGFVVFQQGQQAGLLSATQGSALVAAVALSLATTPALLLLSDRWLVPRLAQRRRLKAGASAPLSEPQQAPVIIAGFGRYGQIVGRMLHANGLSATVLEHDADQVESMRRFGWQVFYGDASRLDLLRTAGAAEARVLVLAVDDIGQSLAIAALAREHFPQLQLVARARNVEHMLRLRELGVRLIERETFDSALMSARSVLELMGLEPAMARKLAWHFRRHNLQQLEELAPHQDDHDKLIALVKQGRRQLETLMAQEQRPGEHGGESGEGEHWNRR